MSPLMVIIILICIICQFIHLVVKLHIYVNLLSLLKIIIQSKIISQNHFLTHSSLCGQDLYVIYSFHVHWGLTFMLFYFKKFAWESVTHLPG